MQSTLEEINNRLKDAPQELLDRVMGYLDALTFDITIPEWQKNEVLRRLKEYENNPDLALDADKVMEALENKYK